MQAVAVAPTLVKPRLRGVSHQIAFFVSLAAGAVLAFAAPGPRAMVATLVYAGSLAAMFGISALYHRPTWAPRPRALMRRLDHAAIFVLIAGTGTPLAMLLEPSASHMMLTITWGGAALGAVKAILWPHAPKPLTALVYLAVGWSVVPFMDDLNASLGSGRVWLIAAGGLVYSAGAVVYALRRPNPFPKTFGYHEIFHALVVVASILHFAVVASVVPSIR